MSGLKKEFPSQGVGFQDVLSSIQKRKVKDVKWDSGKMFGFVYHPGDIRVYLRS